MTEAQQIYQHLKALEKAQGVRLFDVLLLGPVMIYAGTQLKRNKNLGLFLSLSGLGTIAFNGANYVRIEQLKQVNKV